MRDFVGLQPAAVPSTVEGLNDYLPTLRRDVATLDYFLRDLSRGMGLITKGLVPDGSGEPIINQVVTDDWWFKPGRSPFTTAFMDTAPGGGGFISSTKDTTKGFVYIGEGSEFSFDEANTRLGIRSPTPDATLHLVSASTAQTLGTSVGEDAGGYGLFGAASISAALLTDDGGTSGIQGPQHSAGGVIGCEVSLALPSGGPSTGWILHIVARKNGSTAPPLDNVKVWANRSYSAGSYSSGSIVVILGDCTPSGSPTTCNPPGIGTGYLRDTVSPALSTSYVDYGYSFTPSEITALLAATRISVLFSSNANGFGSGTTVEEITRVYIEVPGDTALPIQRWEDADGNLIDMSWDRDGAAAVVLSVQGSNKLRFENTGLEFAIGTPADDKFWRCTDAEGTGAWETITAASFPHVMLDSNVHTDTVTQTVSRGSLIYGNSTPKWDELTIGSAGKLLRTDGTDVAWSTTTWPNSSTTGDLLYASASNTYGNLADVAAGSFLRSGGVSTAPAWSTTVWTNSATQGDILYASASNTYSNLAKDTNATRYLSNTGTSNNPAWAQVNLANGVTGTLPIANGGTALSAQGRFLSTTLFSDVISADPVSGDLIVALGAPAWQRLPAGDVGHVLIITSDAPKVIGWGSVAGVLDSVFYIYDNLNDTKHLEFQCNGISAGTTRTWTAQDASGTVAFLADIPTVDSARTWSTLQKFPDDKLNIVGSADATKILRMEVDGLTTATTRTATWPDADLTVVGVDTTQTLTNKTLTAPKFADLGFIADANGNEIIILDTVASAVNEWTLANAATGANPKLTASGGDSNVGLDFQVKGTGVYRFLATTSGPTDLRLFEDADNGTNYVSIKAPSSLSADRVGTLPSANDFTFAGLEIAQTFTKTQIFNTDTDSVSMRISGDGAGTKNWWEVTDEATGNVRFAIFDSTMAAQAYTISDPATASLGDITAGLYNYVTLVAASLTGIRTATFPNVTGTVPLFSALPGASGRVVFASGTAGLVTTDSDMSFSTDTLSVTKIKVPTSGTVVGALDHGTYTPTLTGVTNVAASTAYVAQYLRLGNTVTVSGKVDIDVTAAGATELGISLPIASNLANQEDVGGTAVAYATIENAAIRADATNDRAAMLFVATTLTNQSWAFHFTYEVI